MNKVKNIWSPKKRKILKESVLVEGSSKTGWIHLVIRCDQFLACVVPCHPRATGEQSFGYVYPIFWGQTYQQLWWWLDALRLNLLCPDIGLNSTPTIVTRSEGRKGRKRIKGRKKRKGREGAHVNIRGDQTLTHPGVTWGWSYEGVTPSLEGRLISGLCIDETLLRKDLLHC